MEQSLPQSVDIGPFHVNTDTVRLALAKKHKDIVRALLDFLVLQLRKESDQVCVWIIYIYTACNVYVCLYSGTSLIRTPLAQCVYVCMYVSMYVCTCTVMMKVSCL